MFSSQPLLRTVNSVINMEGSDRFSVTKNELMPEIGSISDVANIYRYERKEYVPVDVSEHFPSTQKYDNISLMYILKRKKKKLLAGSANKQPFGSLISLSKFEVNGYTVEYYIELPKNNYMEVIQPLRLPEECRPIQGIKKIDLLREPCDTITREVVFPSISPSIALGRLQFEANFECGNLSRAEMITRPTGEQEYDLHLRKDTGSAGGEFWYFFRVKGCLKGREYRFNIRNYNNLAASSGYAISPIIFR